MMLMGTLALAMAGTQGTMGTLALATAGVLEANLCFSNYEQQPIYLESQKWPEWWNPPRGPVS